MLAKAAAATNELEEAREAVTGRTLEGMPEKIIHEAVNGDVASF